MAVPIRTQDIAWLAGLLEGEGCFKFNTNTNPSIVVAMTDRDVIERAARLMGGRVSAWSIRERNKVPYFTGIYGNRAASWMMTLYPLLGQRRQEKVREILAVWRQKKVTHRANVICGHLDQPHRAKGLCQPCYDRQRPPRVR